MKSYIVVGALAMILSATVFTPAQAARIAAENLAAQRLESTKAESAKTTPAVKGDDKRGGHSNCGGGGDGPGCGHQQGTWRCMQVGKNQWVANCLGPVDNALPHSACPGLPPLPCHR